MHLIRQHFIAFMFGWEILLKTQVSKLLVPVKIDFLVAQITFSIDFLVALNSKA